MSGSLSPLTPDYLRAGHLSHRQHPYGAGAGSGYHDIRDSMSAPEDFGRGGEEGSSLQMPYGLSPAGSYDARTAKLAQQQQQGGQQMVRGSNSGLYVSNRHNNFIDSKIIIFKKIRC